MRELRATPSRALAAHETAPRTALHAALPAVAAAAALALGARTLTHTPIGLPVSPAVVAARFGVVCALALSSALLILAFIKGAFAWETVISAASSAVGARRAPDMDRRAYRPPRVRPRRRACPAPHLPLLQLHLQPAPQPFQGPTSGEAPPVAMRQAQRQAQRQAIFRAPAPLSPKAVGRQSPRLRLDPAQDPSSAICRIPACGSKGGAT